MLTQTALYHIFTVWGMSQASSSGSWMDAAANQMAIKDHVTYKLTCVYVFAGDINEFTVYLYVHLKYNIPAVYLSYNSITVNICT